MFKYKWMIGALVLIYLLGVGTGFLFSIDTQSMSWNTLWLHSSDPASMTQRIKEKLMTRYHLTPQQESRITPLIQSMSQHLYELRTQYGKDALQTLDDYHLKVEQEMPADQRMEYADRYAKKRAELSKQLNP